MIDKLNVIKQDNTRDTTDAIQKIKMKIKRRKNKYNIGNNEEWLTEVEWPNNNSDNGSSSDENDTTNDEDDTTSDEDDTTNDEDDTSSDDVWDFK